MNPYLPVFCVYICITICSTEKLKSDKISDKSQKERHPSIYKKPTYKSKEDIPPELIEKLTKMYDISEDPVGDREREEEKNRVKTYDDYYDEDFTTAIDSEAAQGAYFPITNSDSEEMFATENKTESNETCKVCELREQEKSLRLEQIKSTILNKLGFSSNNLPNVTNKAIPNIPAIQRIIEDHQMQGDAPYPSDDYIPEDHLYGDIKRAYTIAQSSK